MRSNRLMNGLLALVCLAGMGMAPLFAEEAAQAEAEAVAPVDAGAVAAENAKKAAEAAKVAAAEAAQKAAEIAAKAEEFLKYIPETVVTANGEAIVTRQQVVDFVKPQLLEALGNGVQLDDAMVQPFVHQFAELMGMNELIIKAAKAAGVKPDEKACEEQLKGYIQQAGGEEQLDAQLKAAGMTRDFLTEKMREQSIAMQYQEKALADVKVPEVTEEDLKKFYEENKERMVEPATLSASHILVQFPPSEEPPAEEKAAALKKLQEVKAQLKEDGSNFAELAKLHSDCPSKENGGDLGRFQPGQMMPEFEAALLKLKEGEISEPVETKYGYHLIKAGARTEARDIPFDEVKEEMADYLKGRAEQEVKSKAWREKVEALKKAADFKLLLPEPKRPEPPKAEAPAEEAPAPAKAE